MALEHHVNPITLPVQTTGLAQYRFVNMGPNGLTWPASGGVGGGVLGASISTMTSATTQSYLKGRAGTICQLGSVCKIESTASTLKVGSLVTCTSRGRARKSGLGDAILGVVIGGSTGSARFLTVNFTMFGVTT